MNIRHIFFIFIFITSYSFAQEPAINVVFDDEVCLNQNVVFENNSTNAESYVWDFCPGDLNEIPTVEFQGTFPELNTPFSLELFGFNNTFYGLIPSRNANAIFLADFSMGIDQTPVVSNFNVPAGNLDGPTGVSIIDSAGHYFAFSVNLDNGDLIRSHLGTNPTTLESVDNLTDYGTVNFPDGVFAVNDTLNSYKVLVL